MPTKVQTVKAMVLPVVMYRYESWTIKKAEHWRLMLSNSSAGEYSWESLGPQGDPVNPKGNQPWIFIGRTDAEAPILWPPDVKSRLIEKDPDAGKDWGPEEKGATEDEMVGWNHPRNGHEFEQIPGDSERQGNLVCYCSCSWGVGHELATGQHFYSALVGVSSCHFFFFFKENFWQCHVSCGI